MDETPAWMRLCAKNRLWPCHSMWYAFCIFLLLVKPAEAFSPEKARFSILFGEEEISYQVLGVFAMPEQVVQIAIADPDQAVFCTFEPLHGQVLHTGPGQWRWTAPRETGLYPLEIAHAVLGETILLNAFVMVPHSRVKGGYLNGYRIGEYPKTPLKGLDIYNPPPGFIEVTEKNEHTLVAPHFSLKQFLCKQDGGYPKYLVLKERLLLKLELILEKANEKGYRCQTLTIMSGYRTPFYNRAIGNVRYSQHVWGGAADFYIDTTGDGMMDDLNGDGKIDYRDAALLYDLIDDMFGRPWYQPFIGGLGLYEKTPKRGPFVHTDVRGFKARWGRQR